MLGDTTEMAGLGDGRAWIAIAAVPCVLAIIACMWRAWRVDIVLPVLSIATLWILQHGYWDAVADQVGPDATTGFPDVRLPGWLWLALAAVAGGSALIAARLLASTMAAAIAGMLAWTVLATIGAFLVVPYAVGDGFPLDGPMRVSPEEACRTVAMWGGAYLPVLFVAFSLVARFRAARSGAGGP